MALCRTTKTFFVGQLVRGLGRRRASFDSAEQKMQGQANTETEQVSDNPKDLSRLGVDTWRMSL
jgi:hypothetical protein